jgi:hypothetical protein
MKGAKFMPKNLVFGQAEGGLFRICDFIETTPVFMINDLVDAFQISYNTASSRVDMLVEMNIVKKDNEQHRNRIFE